MDQQPLEDVVVTAEMRAAHPARLVEMREGAFDVLPVDASGGVLVCHESADDCDTLVCSQNCVVF
jgi:hypothetical protein